MNYVSDFVGCKKNDNINAFEQAVFHFSFL